jgi:hypothetical protein
MKTQLNSLLETLNSNDIKTLTTEVKETVCKSLKKARRFSAAEYWDIQRRRRNILVKRMAY